MDNYIDVYNKLVDYANQYDKEIAKANVLEEKLKSRVVELSPSFDAERNQVLNKLKELYKYVGETWNKVKSTCKSSFNKLNLDAFNEGKLTLNRNDPLDTINKLYEQYVKFLKGINSAYDVNTAFISTANMLLYYLNKCINDFSFIDRAYWSAGRCDDETIRLSEEISKIENSLIDIATNVFYCYDELRLLLDNENQEKLNSIDISYEKTNTYTCPIFFKLGLTRKAIKEFKLDNHDKRLGLENQYLYEYEESYINLDEEKETNDAVLFAYDRSVIKDEIIDALKDNAYQSYPKDSVLNMIINSSAKAEELKNIIENTHVDNIPLHNVDNPDTPIKVPFAFILNPELIPFRLDYASDKAYLFFTVFIDDLEKYEKSATHIYLIHKEGEELIAIDKKKDISIQLKSFKA